MPENPDVVRVCRSRKTSRKTVGKQSENRFPDTFFAAELSILRLSDLKRVGKSRKLSESVDKGVEIV